MRSIFLLFAILANSFTYIGLKITIQDASFDYKQVEMFTISIDGKQYVAKMKPKEPLVYYLNFEEKRKGVPSYKIELIDKRMKRYQIDPQRNLKICSQDTNFACLSVVMKDSLDLQVVSYPMGYQFEFSDCIAKTDSSIKIGMEDESITVTFTLGSIEKKIFKQDSPNRLNHTKNIEIQKIDNEIVFRYKYSCKIASCKLVDRKDLDKEIRRIVDRMDNNPDKPFTQSQKMYYQGKLKDRLAKIESFGVKRD